MKVSSDIKNLIVLFLIGISLLIYSVFNGQFSLIIMSFEFIILTIIEYLLKYYGYNLLGDKKFFEWIISSILLIIIFGIFYPSIYENNTSSFDMSLFILFYFNWFYVTNLINNFLNNRVNNYVQWD